MNRRKYAAFAAIAAIAVVATVAIPIALSAAATPAAANKPVVRWVWMSGAQEIPTGDPDAAGMASILISPSNNRICWLVNVKRFTQPATAMHIHPGRKGQTGPPLVNLTAPNATGHSSGCVTSTSTDAIAADPHGYYINVHTNDYAAGAVRGQL